MEYNLKEDIDKATILRNISKTMTNLSQYEVPKQENNECEPAIEQTEVYTKIECEKLDSDFVSLDFIEEESSPVADQ